MISSTNRSPVSRRRGAARWLPAVLSLVVLGVVCSMLGAYILAPVMAPGAPAPEATQTAAAPPPNAPVVSYPSGANQVTIVEKPVKQAAPAPPTEPENGITTTIEPAEGESEAADTRTRGRDDHQRQKPGEENPEAKSGSETGTAEPARTTPAAGEAAAGDSGIVIEPTTPTETTRPTAPSSASAAERPSSEGGSLFRVQVGRFADEGDARALAEELRRDGLTPSVVRTGPDGRGLYRVQVGTYRQRENAEKALEALRRKQLEPYLAEDEP